MIAPPVITPIGSNPVPIVTLTKAGLVYTTVTSGGVGYLEPAYLFTGTFSSQGFLYEKRVLIPAVAASAIGAP